MEAFLLEECKNRRGNFLLKEFIGKEALMHVPMSVIPLEYRLLSNSLLKLNSLFKKSIANL